MRHLILVVLVVIAVVALLLAAVSLWGEADGRRSLSSMTYGWAVPLASVFVVVGVIWLLLSQTPGKPPANGRFRYVTCPACGREVLEDWRLCPYCGTFLDQPSSELAEPPAPGTG